MSAKRRGSKSSWSFLTLEHTYLALLLRAFMRSCSSGPVHGDSAFADADAVSEDSVSCDDEEEEERGRHADAKEYGTIFACLGCVRLKTLVKVY